LKKSYAALEKYINFCIEISWKINEKSSPRVSKTTFVTKMHKQTIPGISFLAKDRFLVDFWVSKGTQKLLKTREPSEVRALGTLQEPPRGQKRYPGMARHLPLSNFQRILWILAKKTIDFSIFFEAYMLQ